MFTKTLKVLFRGKKIDVLIHLDVPPNEDYFDTSVKIKSMFNEYFLGDEIGFTSRERARDFIKNYTPDMAKDFLIEQSIQAA